MTDLTPYDIHRLDQAGPDAFADVDRLAADPETLDRLTQRGPAVYGAELTRDLHATCDGNASTLAGWAALATLRLVQANERLHDLNAEVGPLRAKVARLTADIDDRDSEISALKQDLDLQTKAAWDNSSRVAELTAEVEQLRTQVAFYEGPQRRPGRLTLVPAPQRAPLYAAYKAAREWAEKNGESYTDDGIIQAAVKAYRAELIVQAKQAGQQPQVWAAPAEPTDVTAVRDRNGQLWVCPGRPGNNLWWRDVCGRGVGYEWHQLLQVGPLTPATAGVTA